MIEPNAAAAGIAHLPARLPDALHVGRPNVGDRARFLARVNDILENNWLTNAGPYVQEFERRVAEMLDVEHCVAICNATIALSLVTRALDLEGEVIMPSFTFVATAHALQWQRIRPVFCDVDPETHNIDPAQIESLITPRTSGILGVHLWGRACAIDQLEAIARKHSLQLLFDAAHAFGCTHRGQMIGGFGRAEVFSFHATKFINTLEGGLVATNDAELAAKLRFMKNFGFSDYDRVDYLGINGKMNEVSAAMGLTNLDAFDEFMAANRRNHDCYRAGLQSCRGLRLLSFGDGEQHNYHYIVLEVDERESGITRDQIVRELQGHQIIARRYFYPGCHRFEPYRSQEPDAGRRLPQTERLAARLICLPTGSTIGATEIDRVCGLLRQMVGQTAREPSAPTSR